MITWLTPKKQSHLRQANFSFIKTSPLFLFSSCPFVNVSLLFFIHCSDFMYRITLRLRVFLGHSFRTHWYLPAYFFIFFYGTQKICITFQCLKYSKVYCLLQSYHVLSRHFTQHFSRNNLINFCLWRCHALSTLIRLQKEKKLDCLKGKLIFFCEVQQQILLYSFLSFILIIPTLTSSSPVYI